MGTYVHLNGHSEYSTDSNAGIAELVAAAKANGQDTLALTDTNLDGALAFRAEAYRHGIKPIIGLDVRLVDDRDSAGNTGMPAFYDLTLLAEDATGWHSLVSIYNASMESRRTHAFVDFALLTRHADGLIALTGGRRGPIDYFIDRNDVDTARANLTKLENAIGTGRVFLEASDPAAAQLLTGVFKNRIVHLVATARYRQVSEDDADARDTLMLVRSGYRRHETTPSAGWVMSEAEMRAEAPASRPWQDAITLASTIAATISPNAIPEPTRQVPSFRAPKGFRSADEYLRHLAFRGAGYRYDEIPLQVIERLNLELELITGNRAAEYLLITRDLITWCQGEGILTAPRGTSSGSLVLYCLEMTDTDPLRHDLKFERFMRTGREALPALDFDVQHSRCQEVHNYLAARWPARVARASSHARVNGSTVSIGAGMRLNEMAAAQVDGRIRYATPHVCAILIAPDEFHDTVPVRIDTMKGHEEGLPTAAWASETLKDQGYMVLNLLGSRTLDVIARTAEAVRATPEGSTHLGILLPDGDGELYGASTGAAWDLIATDDTDGVFQLGADHIAAAAKAAKPRDLTDMAALISLTFREDRLDAYLKARALRTTRYGRYDGITADSTEQIWLSGALDATHGVILFQEQAMGLFTCVGGFSDAQAELAWRTLAKLSPDVAYLREKFIEGAVQEQHDRAGDLRSPVFSETTAGRVFDLLVKATPGAFSAAHAYSYARLAFQTAWLRANFPETFQRVLDEVQPRRKRRVPA